MTITVPAGTDSELVRAAALQPDLDYSDPLMVRAELARAFAISMAFRVRGSAYEDLSIQEQDIPGRPGSPPIRIRTYEKVNRERGTAALVFFHGGAFVGGGLETEHLRAMELARGTGMLVISADYRLAPEHPFPLGLHDCYDTMAWAVANASRLNVDADRVAVGGSSAGGALAAAVALMARDQGHPGPVFQLLLYPVMDDRMTTASMRAYTDTPGWNQPNSVHMWRLYLSGQPTTPYAAPARAADLTGLPPAYVLTAEFDPLRDEGIDYAVRLLRAGIPTEIHQFPGTFHGFDSAEPCATVSRQALDEQIAALLRGCRVRAGQWVMT